MRAVIYARYSCDHQREDSIEGQLRECKDFAEKNNLTVVTHYIDRTMSPKTDNRPQFQQMIKDSDKGLFDVIIVWKLDRFARNRYDSAHYKAMLRRNGVKVIFATEVISEGAEGIILESVLEGFAEYYSAELSEKVIRGMKENALKCQYNGGPVPIGYKIDEDKHYQIDELVAPFVVDVFQMYVDGKQMKEITEYLKELHVTSSSKKLSKTTVSSILQNRKYMGEYKYRDVVVPNGIPAIVSEELFNMAQDRLARNRHAPSSYKSDDRYILTTKLMCAECGSTMVGESARGGSGKHYFYYKCSNAKKNLGCTRRAALRKAEIEKKVIDKIADVMFDAQTIDRLADKVIAWQDKADTAIPLLQRELAEVEKGLDNIMSAIEQGIITPTTKKRMAELEEKKKDIEVKIAKEEFNTRILTKEQMVFWLTKITKLDLTDDANKQRIIDTFVNSIYVHDDRLVINLNCRDEEETVPLQAESSSSFLSASGEPIHHNSNIYLNEKVFGVIVYF